MTTQDTMGVARAAARGRLRGLLLFHACCWAGFFGIAWYVQARGGVVSLPWAALAPVVPLVMAPSAFADGAIGMAIGCVALSLVPPALVAVAARTRAHAGWGRAAAIAIGAQWLLMLMAMGTGA